MFQIDSEEYSPRKSTYHPCLWFVVRAPRLLRPRTVRLPDDCDLPDNTVFGEHKHVAVFLVYVDDFLAAGPREFLQPLRLLHVWKGSNPDFLGRQPGNVDAMRFLGLILDIEMGPEEGTWLVHQQSYIYAFLQEMFDPECLKDRRTPGEPNHSPTSHMLNHMRRKHWSSIHYNRAKIVWNILQLLVWLVFCYGCPCEHVLILHGRLPGLPDSQALMKLVLVCVCILHVALYLRRTLHFALFYEPVRI